MHGDISTAVCSGDCTYYFIDNEYYFKRGTLYGHYDDAERFAFFSRAILEMLPYIDFHPDIIHANDWQTALVPVYYYLFYSHRPWYYNIKSLFTIHNIQYQGEYGWEVNTECVGIPASECNILEMNGKLNMMKGAIETSTRVSTVSPSYAAEIKDPWYSWGLHDELNLRHYKLCGIKNGIDVASYDPATDYQIYCNYTKEDMSGKGECKRRLQERLTLEVNWSIPLVAMVTRLVSHKGLDLVRMGLEELMNTENMQFVILGSGDKEYEDYFNYMQAKYPGRLIFCHGFVPELARKIYSGADIFLMPSAQEPCGLAQMIALRYGTIPVVREVGGLKERLHLQELLHRRHAACCPPCSLGHSGQPGLAPAHVACDDERQQLGSLRTGLHQRLQRHPQLGIVRAVRRWAPYPRVRTAF